MLVGIKTAHQAARAGRPRLFACLIALAAIGQTVVLPLIDHQAVEYSPWHTHVVLGSVNWSEAAWALAHHDHVYERTSHIAADEAASTPARVRVVSTDSGRTLTVAWAIDLTATLFSSLRLPAASLWQPLSAAEHGLAWRLGVPPLPPPRLR